jgi:hypothetical protein
MKQLNKTAVSVSLILPVVSLVAPSCFFNRYFLPREFLFVVLTILVTGYYLFFEKKSNQPTLSLKTALIWGLFIGASILSTIGSADPQIAAGGAILFGTWGIAVILMKKLFKNVIDRTFFSHIALTTGFIQSCIVLVQCIRTFCANGYIWNASDRLLLIGTLGNPEYVAALLCMIIIIWWFNGNSKKKIETVAAVIITGTIVLCQSRGALIALALAVLVTYLFCVKKPSVKRWVQISTVGLFLVLILSVTVALWFDHSVPLARLNTIRGRVLLWVLSFPMISYTSGLGCGFNNIEYYVVHALFDIFKNPFFSGFTSQAAMVHRIHNEYLDFIVEGGIILGLCGGLVLFRIFTIIRTAGVNIDRGALGGLVFSLLFSFWSFPFHLVPTLFISGYCIACIIGIERNNVSIKIPFTRMYTGFIMVLLLVLSMLYYLPVLRADIIHRASRNLINNNASMDALQLINTIPLQAQSPVQKLTRIRLLYNELNIDEALVSCKELVSKAPTIDNMKMYGLLLFDRGELSQSTGVYKFLSGAFPLQVTPPYMLGRIYMKTGQYYEAEKYLRIATSLDAKSEKAAIEQDRARLLLRQLNAK